MERVRSLTEIVIPIADLKVALWASASANPETPRGVTN